MEGEYFDRQDVVRFPERKEQSAWMESLRRVARAQAILWNRAPIQQRMRILAELDEAEGKQK